MCLSVRKHISRTAGPIFTKFCLHGRGSVLLSGGVAIRYVLPVLWMTSRLAAIGCTAIAALRCRGGIWCLYMNALFKMYFKVFFNFWHKNVAPATRLQRFRWGEFGRPVISVKIGRLNKVESRSIVVLWQKHFVSVFMLRYDIGPILRYYSCVRALIHQLIAL